MGTTYDTTYVSACVVAELRSDRMSRGRPVPPVGIPARSLHEPERYAGHATRGATVGPMRRAGPRPHKPGGDAIPSTRTGRGAAPRPTPPLPSGATRKIENPTRKIRSDAVRQARSILPHRRSASTRTTAVHTGETDDTRAVDRHPLIHMLHDMRTTRYATRGVTTCPSCYARAVSPCPLRLWRNLEPGRHSEGRPSRQAHTSK